MDERKRTEEEKGLDVDEQSVADIDVPEQEADEASGGMMMEAKGGSVTGTGCRGTVSIRAGCTPA